MQIAHRGVDGNPSAFGSFIEFHPGKRILRRLTPETPVKKRFLSLTVDFSNIRYVQVPEHYVEQTCTWDARRGAFEIIEIL